MVLIQNSLVIGIGVNGGHKASSDTKGIIQYLDNRCQAVCGAGSIRDDGVICRIIDFFIYTHNDGCIFILARCSDNNLLYCAADVLGRAGLIFQFACGFNNDFDTTGGPVQIFRISVMKYSYTSSINNQCISIYDYLSVQTAMHCIILEKICRIGCAAWIVDSYYFQIISFQHPAKYQSADSAKSVNSYFSLSHSYLSC